MKVGDYAIRWRAQHHAITPLEMAEITGEENAAGQLTVRLDMPNGHHVRRWHRATILRTGTQEELQRFIDYRRHLLDVVDRIAHRLDRHLTEVVQNGLIPEPESVPILERA
jgi:hypothetical protein